MEFRDSLASYYVKWFFDCHDSAIYCKECGNNELAREYLNNARVYLNIIMENWDKVS